MAGTLMNIKRNTAIIIVVIAVLAIAVWIAVDINFFREISPVSPEPVEAPAVETGAGANYEIPSPSIPTIPVTGTTTPEIMEKRRALQEKETEAERARIARRAQAFELLKRAEVSLPSAEVNTPKAKVASTPPAPPIEDSEPPSAEAMKAMEEKGILSY